MLGGCARNGLRRTCLQHFSRCPQTRWRGDGKLRGDKFEPELEAIVRERVETLWDMGISGADLVIASVGAGLRAFTRFARVEYANGEEVPAERFLTEVETVVLETILSRLSKEVWRQGRPDTVWPAWTQPRVFTSCGATPTARRNWTQARPSSSPMAHMSNWNGPARIDHRHHRPGGEEEGQISPSRFQRARGERQGLACRPTSARPRRWLTHFSGLSG